VSWILLWILLLDMTESRYIELVQWTGEQLHPAKRGNLNLKAELGGKPAKVISKLSKHSDRIGRFRAPNSNITAQLVRQKS